MLLEEQSTEILQCTVNKNTISQLTTMDPIDGGGKDRDMYC